MFFPSSVFLFITSSFGAGINITARSGVGWLHEHDARWDNGDGIPIFRYYLSWHIMGSVSPIEDLYHPIIHDFHIYMCVCLFFPIIQLYNVVFG